MVSGTSTGPQNYLGNYLGPCTRDLGGFGSGAWQSSLGLGSGLEQL